MAHEKRDRKQFNGLKFGRVSKAIKQPQHRYAVKILFRLNLLSTLFAFALALHAISRGDVWGWAAFFVLLGALNGIIAIVLQEEIDLLYD